MAWPRFCASSIKAKVLSPSMFTVSIGSIWTATFSGLVMLRLVVAARSLAGVQAAGTPLLVEYSKCSAVPGCTMGWIAWAAMAPSLNPCRINLSLPG